MSSNLHDVERGGEQTQYEGAQTESIPHKKSGGQFGNPQTTTDPSQTSEAAAERAERGQKTAENIRYGQTISEGGMSGYTTGQQGEANQGGFGRVKEGEGEDVSDGVKERRAAGYGGSEDMDRSVGA
ncbi:hypothetical protein M409DRAFT_58485 [Zasmidium cellare ATCC 36951]|uniref:Uncharacterized protein n=1 Tax=Zasmidium cellare ATCC 36951 TaxID=1080233 RepID=A0A6A6C5V4_ZASCE|nr:uncharacterized protein M409DRAFT_58485 [Zasmidium cellare ATCC 36951]KAF2162395.1 hypothetical protein M409DRAFT_58485 [Zasmidium cellare ATCC 36951]